MALPKKPPSSGGMSDLVERAASVGASESYEDGEGAEAEEDDVMKEEFFEMARLIREGDDEGAYQAYLACKGA